jgi:GTP cyclohydrolase I
MEKVLTKEQRLAEAAFDILQIIGENFGRPGLKETPDRFARYLLDLTAGYAIEPGAVLKTFEDGAENVDELVFQGSIPFFSLCEHHMAPFFGVAHIGYIPNGKILGLSKFARLIEVFARRLQVQERLTNQIADALVEHLAPHGVGVIIRARHLCMESRGVQKIGTITYTSALRGALRMLPEARGEFLEFAKMADARQPAL